MLDLIDSSEWTLPDFSSDKVMLVKSAYSTKNKVLAVDA